MANSFFAQGPTRYLLTVAACLLGLASPSLLAAPTEALRVHDQLARTNITGTLEFFTEANSLSPVETIAALPPGTFAPYEKTSIREGLTDRAWWFRIPLRNDSASPVRVVLDTENPFLDRIDLFAPDTSGFKQRAFRDGKERLGSIALNHPGAIQIDVPGNSDGYYYLRVLTSTPLTGQFSVASNNAFLQEIGQDKWRSGLVYGALLGLLLYNLLLLATVREGMFVTYVFYVCALLGTLAGVEGLIHEAFPSSGHWPTTFTFILLNLAIGTLALLTCLAPGQVRVSRQLQTAGISLAGINLLAMHSFLFLGPAQSVVFSVYVAIATLALASLLALYQARRVDATLRLHLLSSVAFNIAGLLALLAFLGVLPDFPLALALIKLTVAAKLGLLSVALGGRINELKRSEATLADQAQNATDESRATNRFLAKMSHDIRTPLNGLIGLAEVLGNTRLDREQRQALCGIQESGDSLVKLVNDAMDFSLIEAGKLRLEIGNYDLETVLNECITLVSQRAEEKDLELALGIRKGTPTGLRGDPARLRQIVLYLVGNALEYTDSGSIVVHARASTDRAGRRCTHISITDTGKGISKEAHAHLFDAYSKHPDTDSGLGLAISKKLVEMMNGTIGFRSVPNAGSTFWIEIPEKRSLVDAIGRKSPEWVGNRKPSVLLVDGHPAYTSAFREDLVAGEIDLRVATSIQGAARIVRDAEVTGSRVSLVLFDQASITAQSLGEAEKKDLRVIGKLTKTALMQAVGTTDGHDLPWTFTFKVGKPRTGRQLETVVRNILIGEPAARLDNWSDEDDVKRRLADLRVLVVDDNEVSTMVSVGFLQRMGIQCADIAMNGEEAIDQVRGGRFAYDLILMDCEMPVMDGYQATRQIRSWEGSQGKTRSKIVAVSAHALPEMVSKNLEAGMDDHIAKPLQYAGLRDRLLDLFPEAESDAPENFARHRAA